ncbi:hypothetical protein [Rhizobium sp. Leaf341]|uniref:hypothetical protein n=1 Tax=Rhizobium sp. Leaf341 TaxID=1736344 RepID=UPI00071495B5|nr:hypothetical protein [Rhizobium sp. Leaf341]KQR70816.1 hypothetical protein ASG03_04325 [Rhizobium sp. Leaf341]
MASHLSIRKSRYLISVALMAGLTAGSALAQDATVGTTPAVVPAPIVAAPPTSVAPGAPDASSVVPAAQPTAPAAAPPVTVAEAVSCLMPPAKLSDEKVSEFTSDPQSLLLGTESGGMILSTRVNGLAGSSSATLDNIMALTTTANKAQIQAIGQGLARAATICAKASPPYAALIQSKVAEMNSETLSLAFVAGLSDVQTASVSSGAGGASSGASGIGGDGTAGGGTAGESGDDSIPTTSGVFNGKGVGSAFNVPTDGSSSRFVSPN